ncbi:MAG: YbaB/EbfC family nucleoid-associated protein [Proteobacteria bacterium]|nr:YbaB/EbfC family nucleoid-associated protein [Pseudomonadota bacterium]
MDNLGQMLKKAGELQAKMAEIQEQMAAVEITGTSGGGMVRVTLSGRGEARKVAIDPTLADDTEVMEDLIVAAFNDARSKVEALMAEKMGELTGGMPLPPGLRLPF